MDVMSLLPSELEELCREMGQPSYRAKQIFTFLSRGVPIEEMTTLPKDFRRSLANVCEDRLPRVEEKQVSALDGTVKYLFRLFDGEYIESVFMRYEHGNTLCISSEVGCPMGCAFCASTLGGKVRPLLPSEMLGQIIATERDIGERVSGVVMMGIGEPLDNYDNVIRFLKLVNHKDGLGIGYRHISLSTCGVVPGIKRLAEEELPITLSISLHAVTDEKRSALMPVNRKWNIDTLLTACADYYRKTSRRISFEYTLLAGENDGEDEARALASLLKRYMRGMPIHVNLIRVNEVKERAFVRGDAESVRRFAEVLSSHGVNATVRRRLGSDIDGACGQLRRRAKGGER
ncbi:MAG: 23S rRNA (adenine(2503)-C(2))-methyltransferase RlmN [Ruminococcaceae bacterium]|nr:23S rRNA (adenine(2503)-C(2))-methyltransferase RlmN [Oscillospiraceae bacterium]